MQRLIFAHRQKPCPFFGAGDSHRVPNQSYLVPTQSYRVTDELDGIAGVWDCRCLQFDCRCLQFDCRCLQFDCRCLQYDCRCLGLPVFGIAGESNTRYSARKSHRHPLPAKRIKRITHLLLTGLSGLPADFSEIDLLIL